MNTQNLPVLKIHKLTQKQYEDAAAAGNVEETALYLTPEADHVVEVGTSDDGLWYYRKWASGRAECWTDYPGLVVEKGMVTCQLPFPFRQKPFVSFSHIAEPVSVDFIYCYTGDDGVAENMHAKLVVAANQSDVNTPISARIAVHVSGYWTAE